MHVDYALIGSRIRLARKQCGLTQERLAEKLSVSVGYVSQIERGATKISLDTLASIASLVSCDLGFLASGTATEQTVYLQQELLEKYALLSQNQKRLLLDFMDLLIKNDAV